MKRIKQLIKLISIIVLFTIPASCDLVNEQIIIENGVNVGSCHINLTYDRSAMNVTNVEGVDFDATGSNLEHVDEGWAGIAAYQANNPGLNGHIILADVTFNKTANVSDVCSVIGITVNTLKDAAPYPQDNPISYTVEGCTIVVSAPPTTTPTDSNDGGGGDRSNGGSSGGMIPTPTPSPTPTISPTAASAATTPVEEEIPAETATPTPEKVTAFHTEPSSLPSPILSPIAAIIIVMIVTVFGIIRVLGITAQAKDETYTEAIASIKQAECKKAATAIIGIVVVAVTAIIAVVLLMM